jgi:TLD
LIKFIPKKSDKSEILSDLQISNLVEHFPSMMMMMDWTLVYSINRDGDSEGTFFEKCKQWKYTLLVIKDTNGYIFGGFCSEPWRSSSKFFGTGENFLYTFKDGDNPSAYYWSGEND